MPRAGARRWPGVFDRHGLRERDAREELIHEPTAEAPGTFGAESGHPRFQPVARLAGRVFDYEDRFVLPEVDRTERLAETVIGLFKTEVIHRRGPWRNLEAVGFATLEWVDRFNDRRLLEPIGNIPPAEAEARFHA